MDSTTINVEHAKHAELRIQGGGEQEKKILRVLGVLRVDRRIC
jgi:hypothetical protein